MEANKIPCYEVNTVTVDLKAADWAILKNSLKAKDSEFEQVSINERSKTASAFHRRYGWVTVEDGTVTVEGSQRAGVEAANAINRGYSRQVLKATAARFGWALKQTPGTNQFVATKRY